MSLRIAGMGWVTPLGRGIDSVWDRLLRGEEAVGQLISDPVSEKTYPAFRVPDDAYELPPHPRLRRVSAISRFATAAGLDALADARSTIGDIDPKRLALIFAVSNGGVVYTRRFYHNVVESGAQSASPLLFPETVFNAPASHLAAILGVTGTSYTLVGDGAIGVLAVKMANDLLQNETFDFCLVVGAEEADWILCDGYHKWRLLKSRPPIELFRDPPGGMILSEGAGALLLGRKGEVQIDAIDAGGNFSRRQEAKEIVLRILRNLKDEPACVVACANGTFVDLAERDAIEKVLPQAIIYSPKPAFGENVGASATCQIIVAAQALRTKRLPPMLHSDAQTGLNFPTTDNISSTSAVVSSCGLNQQAAGLRLRL